MIDVFGCSSARDLCLVEMVIMAGVFCICAGSVLLVLSLFTTCWAAGSEEIASALVDVILPRDQTRLEQVLVRAEPYDTLKAAYHLALGATALRDSDTTKKVDSL